MRRLLTILICAVAIHATAQTPVAIQVDLSKPVGTYKPIYSWFGYDESNYTTMKYGKQLLTELHDLSPVPVYIRAHHLLTSGDGVAEGDDDIGSGMHFHIGARRLQRSSL